MTEDTRFNGSIRKTPRDNAMRNQKALQKMSHMELYCGITTEEFDRRMREQRERVLRRYGVRHD